MLLVVTLCPNIPKAEGILEGLGILIEYVCVSLWHESLRMMKVVPVMPLARGSDAIQTALVVSRVLIEWQNVLLRLMFLNKVADWIRLDILVAFKNISCFVNIGTGHNALRFFIFIRLLLQLVYPAATFLTFNLYDPTLFILW